MRGLKLLLKLFVVIPLVLAAVVGISVFLLESLMNWLLVWQWSSFWHQVAVSLEYVIVGVVGGITVYYLAFKQDFK